MIKSLTKELKEDELLLQKAETTNKNVEGRLKNSKKRERDARDLIGFKLVKEAYDDLPADLKEEESIGAIGEFLINQTPLPKLKKPHTDPIPIPENRFKLAAAESRCCHLKQIPYHKVSFNDFCEWISLFGTVIQREDIYYKDGNANIIFTGSEAVVKMINLSDQETLLLRGESIKACLFEWKGKN